jgi:hypothetical protein
MPKNTVSDPITDQEIAFARLILSGTMNDRRAAEILANFTKYPARKLCPRNSENYDEGAAHSMRNARTGSMEAARRAGMMPAIAAASASTPMAMVMTGTFTLVIS